jgi:hypothetical protein
MNMNSPPLKVGDKVKIRNYHGIFVITEIHSHPNSNNRGICVKNISSSSYRWTRENRVTMVAPYCLFKRET